MITNLLIGWSKAIAVWVPIFLRLGSFSCDSSNDPRENLLTERRFTQLGVSAPLKFWTAQMVRRNVTVDFEDVEDSDLGVVWMFCVTYEERALEGVEDFDLGVVPDLGDAWTSRGEWTSGIPARPTSISGTPSSWRCFCSSILGERRGGGFRRGERLSTMLLVFNLLGVAGIFWVVLIHNSPTTSLFGTGFWSEAHGISKKPTL